MINKKNISIEKKNAKNIFNQSKLMKDVVLDSFVCLCIKP